MSEETVVPSAVEQAARIVARALELCAERSGWTKRAFARDKWGHPVPVTSPRAVRFCAQGALIKAACEVLDVEISTSTELAVEWTPEMKESRYPVPLELAFRVCGAECVPLLQQVLRSRSRMSCRCYGPKTAGRKARCRGRCSSPASTMSSRTRPSWPSSTGPARTSRTHFWLRRGDGERRAAEEAE